MELVRLPLDRAQGAILAHNVVDPDGRRRLRKGRPLTAGALDLLREMGRRTVYVARLDPDDLSEDEAATRIAKAVIGECQTLRCSRAKTGRVNFYAKTRGLVRIDVARLGEINGCPGVTLATLPRHTPVQAGQMVATLKIIPYAIPESVVAEAIDRAGGNPTGSPSHPTAPMLEVEALRSRSVALVLTGAPGAQERVVSGFAGALGARLERLGSQLATTDFVATDGDDAEEALASALRRHLDAGCDLLLVAGDTAIQDIEDITPRAIALAGGTVECFGAPVDPGNLLLVAYRGETPILGTPGCSRSPKANIVDLVLPRLLVGDRLTHLDLIALAHGGLLEDVPERPLPRSRLG